MSHSRSFCYCFHECESPLPINGAGNPALALADSELRFVPLSDGRPEGLGGFDIRVTDRARAIANAEAAGSRSGADLVTLYGMHLRLV